MALMMQAASPWASTLNSQKRSLAAWPISDAMPLTRHCQITNLIADAVAANRIKRKDATSGHKFAEYVPYWV